MLVRKKYEKILKRLILLLRKQKHEFGENVH